MKIVVLDKENFLSDFPTMKFDCGWTEHDHTAPEDVIKNLERADIAIVHKTVLQDIHFRQLPSLKMITTNSTGYNTIDVAAARQNGITVCNIQDWCTNSVIEHILSFIFSLKRNIIPYHLGVTRGDWKKQGKGSYAIMHKPYNEISGSKMGIFGYGVLGKHLEQKASALGINILISDRKGASLIRPGYHPFDEVIAQSDIIVLLSPLNEHTYKMIAEKEFKHMQSGAILINCGRGGLVDEQDLLRALKEHMISGAALDVMEQEPPDDHHPLLNYNGNNLLLSSHVAFASHESIAANTDQIIANITGFLAGLPQNVVN